MQKNVTSYYTYIDGIEIAWDCPCCGKKYFEYLCPSTERIVDIANGKLKPILCRNCGELISFNDCEFA